MSIHLTYAEAVVTGLVQGVTELFPVSSLGHNVLLPALIGGNWAKALSVSAPNSPYLAFVVGLHVATALAMIAYFRRDWLRIVRGFISSVRTRSVSTADERLAWMIVLASIPVGIAGALLQKVFTSVFAKPELTAVFLAVNGLILLYSERRRRAGAAAWAVPAAAMAAPQAAGAGWRPGGPGRGPGGPGWGPGGGPGAGAPGAGAPSAGPAGYSQQQPWQQQRQGPEGWQYRQDPRDGQAPRGAQDPRAAQARPGGHDAWDRQAPRRGQAPWEAQDLQATRAERTPQDGQATRAEWAGQDPQATRAEWGGQGPRGGQAQYGGQDPRAAQGQRTGQDPRAGQAEWAGRDPRQGQAYRGPQDPRAAQATRAEQGYPQPGRPQPGRPQHDVQQHGRAQHGHPLQGLTQQAAARRTGDPGQAEADRAVAADRRLSTVGYKRGIWVGAAQILALLPGISRDGIVTVAGMTRGLSREDAVRFSFLLSAPAILGAGALKLPDLFGPMGKGIHGPVLVGSLLAAIGAYLSVRFLTKYFSENRPLTPFGIYCLVAGIGSLAWLLLR